MSDKLKAALASFARVFGAAAGAVYLTIGKAPLDLNGSDYRDLANAGLAALVLTAVNWFRSGETRFGTNSEDIGMGGADKLEPPAGRINPKSLDIPHESAVDRSLDTLLAKPVQTDNTPKDGDETHPEQGQEFTGGMR